MTTTTRYKAPALEKGLDILELLADEPDGLTQKEIATSLERNPSEIFRMIVCLEERDYINMKPGTERYQLTLKMFDLANRHPPVKRLSENALPTMNKLAHDIKQSCQIVVYNSGRVVVVAQVDSPHRYNFTVRLGTEVDLLDSASGLVLLAFSDDYHRKMMADSCGAELTEPVNVQLEKIATKGMYEHSSPIVKGVINFGCPIFNHHGEVIASLTIPYIDKGEESAEKKEVRQHIKEAAQQISNQLGAKF